MEQHSRANIPVPVAAIGGWGDLAQVETDDVFAGLADAVEQVHQLLELQSARDGGSRVRAELRVESVDVDGKINLFGQGCNHLVHNVFPCRAFVHAAATVAVEEDFYSVGLALGQGFLLVAIVADADLHQLLYVAELHCVVEDGGMRVFEAFESLAQVHVGVGVENAVFHTYIIKVLVIGEGTAVVAAQNADHLALCLPVGDALAQPCVFLLGGLFYFGIKWLENFWVFVVGTVVQRIDEFLADGLHLVVEVAELWGELVQPDAFFPQVGVVVVAEVDLEGGLPDGFGSVDGASVVARCKFPFDGYDDDLRLFGGARQAIDARVGYSSRIGVEIVFHC